jgi:hypothetical protein
MKRRVQIREKWYEAGKTGRQLGPSVSILGTSWTPVLWDYDEDPDWHKASGLTECLTPFAGTR